MAQHAVDDDGRTDHSNGVTQVGRRTFLAGAGAGATGFAGVAHGRGDSPWGDEKWREDEEWHDDESDEGEEREGRGVAEYDPTLIAHRGFAGLYPENTVGAAAAAARGGRSPLAPSRGADSIEIDVMTTADGDVVVFHDDRLSSRDGGERSGGSRSSPDRRSGGGERGLTDESGLVWETDTETVTSANVLGTDETVPLLEDILEAIPPSVDVNVELKNPGSGDLEFAALLDDETLATQKDVWRPFVESVLEVVEEFRHDFLFSSFYEAALATTRDQSDYAVAPLLWDSIEDGIAMARRYDAEAVHPPYNMIQGTPFYADEYYTEGSDWADVDLLAVAHEEGRDVNVYTIQTWYQASQLAQTGVDGLIADYLWQRESPVVHGVDETL